MSIDPLPVSPNQVDSDAMRTKINQLISDNSSVTVGDTPPASPGEGDLWFDENGRQHGGYWAFNCCANRLLPIRKHEPFSSKNQKPVQ